MDPGCCTVALELMRRCKVRDFYPLPSSREILPGTGFLRAPAKINRTGVQVYSARELGLDGGDKPVRLWRPPEEVSKAVKTFESVTLTDDHPPNGVDAVNWHLLAKGDVRDCAMAGEFTEATVIVRDAGQIEVVQSGKAELSCGYVFDLDMTPGTTPEGEQYDGVQRNIEGNHVAIVDRDRAGSRVRIADKTGATMTKHRIKIGDKKFDKEISIPGFDFTLEVDDAVAVQIGDKFELHSHGIQTAKDAYDAAMAKNKSLQAACDALQKQVAEMGEPDEDDVDEMDADEADAVAAAEPKDTADGPKKAADGRRIGYTKDGKPTLKHRLKLALDREKAWKAAATDQAAIEKRVAERQETLDAALPLLGEDFDAKGKSTHEIRVAAITVAAKDETLGAIVKAQLGDTDPKKLSVGDATRALAVISAVGGRASDTTDASDGDEGDEFSRVLAGDTGKKHIGGGQRGGRNLWLSRNAADSRKHVPTVVNTKAQA